jgi:hypothetical protein
MKQMEQQSKQMEVRMARMPEAVQDRTKATVQEQVKDVVQEQVTDIFQQQVANIVQQQVAVMVREKFAAARQQQLANIAVLSSRERSYAGVPRTLPDSQLSSLRSLSKHLTSSTWTDTLYYTLDTFLTAEADGPYDVT